MSDESAFPDEPTGEALDRDTLFPEGDEPESSARRQVTARGVALVGARVVGGLVGLGVAVATIAAASLLPLPTVSADVPSERIVPVPTAQQLVCPGAILRLSDESGAGATQVSAVGRPIVLTAVSSGSRESTPIASSDAATGGTSAAPTVVSTPPGESGTGERVTLSGAQSQQVAEGDLQGLAASGCTVANGEAWLTGGATTVGRTTLLVLTNPSEVPATVDIELFDETGQVLAPGTRGIIVPPSGQRVLSLAGFKPGMLSPVVHVTSTGGQISAILQQSIVRGLAAGGVDVVDSAPLSSDAVIPGVLFTDVASSQALRGGGEAYLDVVNVLRLFAPGEDEAEVTVSLVPEDGAQTGSTFDLSLDAGAVAEISLEDVPTGTYTVRVSSSVPLAAGVRATSAVGATSDFSWYTPSLQLQERAQLTVAPGPTPVLHLTDASGTESVVELAQIGGAATTVTVPAGGSALVPLTAETSYLLTGFGSLYGAVTYSDGAQLARFGVQPPGATSDPIVVYP